MALQPSAAGDWIDSYTTDDAAAGTTWDYSYPPPREDIIHEIDWDKFKGINLKIGKEVIHLTKEEIFDALFKLFPNLVPKIAEALLERFGEEEEEPVPVSYLGDAIATICECYNDVTLSKPMAKLKRCQICRRKSIMVTRCPDGKDRCIVCIVKDYAQRYKKDENTLPK